MDSLFLLQFACFIFMLINAFIVAVSYLHVRWENKRYERSRWMIVVALLVLAIQYVIQMGFGFRAADDSLGAVVNILVYTPCFSLISMGIYNIEATRSNLRKMILMCSGIYAAIIVVFCVGISLHHSLYIREGLYLMLTLFCVSVFYCIYMIIQEMIRRKNMLETMAATDLLPYVRYSRASVVILWLAVLAMPIAIFSTTLLYIIGPLALLSILFFNQSFVALGYNYVPTEELLDKEEEESAALADEITESSDGQDVESADSKETLPSFSQERQAAIKEKLDKWCEELGYKDTTVNMFTLSRSLNISKNELSRYFTSCLNSTFRIWLAEVRFEAAKKMMLDYPDYNNDIISAECGFSSRSYLYRIFKEKEGCSPTVWRAKI